MPSAFRESSENNAGVNDKKFLCLVSDNGRDIRKLKLQISNMSVANKVIDISLEGADDEFDALWVNLVQTGEYITISVRM